MTPARRAEEALRQLAAAAVPVEDADRAAARRAAVVPEVAEAVREAGAARARARMFGWVAAAAAVAAVAGAAIGARSVRLTGATPAVVGRVRAERGPVVFVRDGRAGEIATPGGAAIGARDEVDTGPEAEASITLATGVRVSVRPSSRLRILEPDRGLATVAGDEVELRSGTVQVRAPRLERSFAVRTPDARVTVRGTAFAVTYAAPAAGGSAATLVEVSEGTVEARSGDGVTLVGAGQHWSSASPEPAPPVPATTAATATATSTSTPTSTPTSTSTSTPTSTATSTSTPTSTATSTSTATATAAAPLAPSSLGEQNRVLQAAHEARRRGDDRAAIRHLDDLLARFPGSPLAQEAKVERFRARERLGEHAAAARDARRYLAEHGDGFARDEARRLAIPPAADAGAVSGGGGK